MSERVQIYSLVNDIKEIADYIKASLDFKAQTLVCDGEKARDAGSHAQQILSYIQANNDYELAQCCCRIDRSLFLLAQGKYSLRPDIFLSFSRCHQALFDIQNFILERLYGIPYKDIRERRYAISHVDGECYETSEGVAKKIMPLAARRDEAMALPQQEFVDVGMYKNQTVYLRKQAETNATSSETYMTGYRQRE